MGKIPALPFAAKDGAMRTMSLRAVFLLGFVIVMPLLALPAVARRLDDWIYGSPPDDLAHSARQEVLMQAIEPQIVERASPASFEQVAAPPSPAHRGAEEGLDALTLSPPPLDPLPAFDRSASFHSSSPAEPSIEPLNPAPLDDDQTTRLLEIRRQLETLGAEYILLETTPDSGAYRFHCQMRLSEQAPYNRPFEAVATDPLRAAQQVLADVSAWRTAAREQKIR